MSLVKILMPRNNNHLSYKQNKNVSDEISQTIKNKDLIK